MICEHRDEVAAQLLGGLTAQEALRLDQHVLICDSCAQHRRELSVVRGLLDTVDGDAALVAPSDLGPQVVAAMLAVPQRRPARDFRMVLLGAAAAVVLLVGGFVAFRAARTDTDTDAHPQKMQLVAGSPAPSAWATVNLHPRADGTIVDVEAGDLPHPGTDYALRVTGAGEVLGTQNFTVNTDGWAQVLLATSRPLHKGDMIEITEVKTAGPVTVLRCSCGL